MLVRRNIAAALVRLHGQKTQVLMRGVLQRQSDGASRPRTSDARAVDEGATAAVRTRQSPAGSAIQDLTARQLDLLSEIAAGKSDAAAAIALDWSEVAVKRELAAIDLAIDVIFRVLDTIANSDFA
jgi:DNA-binding NarL/FixJ family response regulator